MKKYHVTHHGRTYIVIASCHREAAERAMMVDCWPFSDEGRTRRYSMSHTAELVTVVPALNQLQTTLEASR